MKVPLLHNHPQANLADKTRQLVVISDVSLERSDLLTTELGDVDTRAIDTCATLCDQNEMQAIRRLPSSMFPALSPDHVHVWTQVVRICALQ